MYLTVEKNRFGEQANIELSVGVSCIPYDDAFKHSVSVRQNRGARNSRIANRALAGGTARLSLGHCPVSSIECQQAAVICVPVTGESLVLSESCGQPYGLTTLGSLACLEMQRLRELPSKIVVYERPLPLLSCDSDHDRSVVVDLSGEERNVVFQ
jgi:hypothetical protein